MTNKAYILMYSGLQNPEKELSEEEVATIRDLVSKLDVVYPGKAHGHLGFSGYAANFEDIHVIARLSGFVQIFDKSGSSVAYSDTTGVLAYLCKIMTPVMIKHNEDAAKAMSDYNETMFGISK